MTPRQFDSALSVSEAVRLLRAVSIEEADLRTSDYKTGAVAHCVRSDHAHKAANNSESLAVRERKGAEFSTPEGASIPCCGKIRCYGNCGFSGYLSEYLLGVGPDGAAAQFWTPVRMNEVVAALRSGEPFSLGWAEWKEKNGFAGAGQAATIGALSVSHSRHSAASFRMDSKRLFPLPEGDLLAEVARTREWDPVLLGKWCEEGLIGISPAAGHDSDVQIAFAYRGLASSRNHPVRQIKARLLHHKDEATRLIRNPDADHLYLGDFSAPGCLQKAPVIALVEGEPDALSWRQMRPEDAVICIGSGSAYGQIPDALPVARIKGRSVIYCIDRDVDDDGFWKVKDPTLHIETLNAIFAEAPSGVAIWVCPGHAGKDPNDFLRAKAGDPMNKAYWLSSANEFPDVMKAHNLPLSPGGVTAARSIPVFEPNYRAIAEQRRLRKDEARGA